MSNDNIDNNGDIDNKGLIKFIRSSEGKKSLNEFIPNENDTLITIINKFIYFNFIYNKLIQMKSMIIGKLLVQNLQR